MNGPDRSAPPSCRTGRGDGDRNGDPLPLRPFAFHSDRVTAVVTTRHGGVSSGPYASLNLGDHVGDDHEAVLENRRRLARRLGVDRLTVADQRHTARVAVVDARLAGRGHNGRDDSRAALPDTDAMVTDVPGVALTVLVADCAPVVLFDPRRPAVAVAHCGRVGTLSEALPAAVAAMRTAFGCRPEDLLVGIGPTVGSASYEIGAREAAEVVAAFGGRDLSPSGLLRRTRPGHHTFDIVAALRTQLQASGVRESAVQDMGVDTRASTGDFFSDRASRPCGRFAAVAMLTG